MGWGARTGAAVLAVIVLNVCDPALGAPASAGGDDPVDRPSSPYDIERLAVTSDRESGQLTVRVRTAVALPDEPPAGDLVVVAAQEVAYRSPCQPDTAGDVTVRLERTTDDDVRQYRATWSAKDGATNAPAAHAFSPDRREVTIEVKDAALTGRTFFCVAGASDAGIGTSSAERRDTAGPFRFSGFEPAPPRLLGPADGVALRGTVPVLRWDVTRPGTSDEVALYTQDPATGAAPTYTTARTATPGAALGFPAREGDVMSLAITRALPFGRHWWTVTRSFGADRQTAGAVFLLGPPDLAALALSAKTVRRPTRRRRGLVELDATGTRWAAVTVRVTRNGTPVATRRLVLGQDRHPGKDLPVDLGVRTDCRRPGLFVAEATARDVWGATRSATRRWRVRAAACRRSSSQRESTARA